MGTVDATDPGAFDQVRQEIRSVTPFRYLGRPVRVQFPLANTTYEVVHQITEVPDGWQWCDGDCIPTRAPGRQHTKQIAYVRSAVANSFAVLAFGMFREDPLNVQAAG